MKNFKLPTKIQVEPIECGAVATWIILGYHKKWLSNDEARNAVNITKDGSTGFNIATALRSFNCQAEGFQPSIEELKKEKPECKYPCIAWVNKIHWIVIERFDGKNFLISDPAKGYRKVTPEVFSKEYSGLVISAVPNENFVKSGREPNAVLDVLNILNEYKLPLFIYILVGFAETIPTIALSSFVGYFADTLLLQNNLDNSYIWLLALIVGISFIFNYLQKIIMRRLHLSLLARLIEKTFQKLISLPLTFYPLRDLGEISQRITLNINLSSILTGNLASAVVGGLTMIIYFLVMLSYNWILGLIVSILGLLIFKTLISVASSLSELSQKSSMSLGKQTSNILFIAQNFNSIKSNGQENSLFQQWSDNFEEYLEISSKQGLILKKNNATTLFLNQLTNYLIVIISGIFILMGKLSLGEFLSFRLIAAAFLGPINILSGVNSQFSNAVGDVNRLKDLWDTEDDNLVKKEFKEIESINSSKSDIYQSTRLILQNPKLEISNLSYKFTQNSEPIFSSINLNISTGDIVSLTGPPGSGKSTLLQCFSSLLDSTYSKFEVSQKPLTDISCIALRNLISYVSQSQYIYDASVKENITLFDDSISIESVLKVIDYYGLTSVFSNLPIGLETKISEKSPINKTTKNYINLLRSLIRHPRIIFIDDVLGQLQKREALRIINLITKSIPVIIFVSRDPDFIEIANKSLVLNNGRLIEIEKSLLMKNLK